MAKEDFKPGAIAVLHDNIYKDEWVEIIGHRFGGVFCVRILSTQAYYYAYYLNMVLQHGVCVEQLTERRV